jgi:hypothetical protein
VQDKGEGEANSSSDEELLKCFHLQKESNAWAAGGDSPMPSKLPKAQDSLAEAAKFAMLILSDACVGVVRNAVPEMAGAVLRLTLQTPDAVPFFL